MNTNQQKDLIEWCSRYKMCKGCPLVGQCIAPLVDADSSKWGEWVEKMHGKIMDEQQKLYSNIEQKNSSVRK